MTASPLIAPPSPLSAGNTESPVRDERAFERFFRTHFQALVGVARQDLGSAANAAPRVVESAFLRVWEARQDPGRDLRTDEDVMAALDDAVHHSAARELSRRAAAQHLAGHRNASNGRAAEAGSLDVDRAWASLTRQLHPDPTAHQHAARTHADMVRHDAATHIASLAKRRSRRAPVIIGAVSLALAGAGVWWLRQSAAESAVTRALASSDTRWLSTSIGQIGVITLDDSTKVTLAPTARIAIPPGYGESVRAVAVEGAAAFDVASASPLPFEIRAGNVAVVVTGTTLAVRAYPNESSVTVHVSTGAATVKAGGTDYPLVAGRSVIIERGGAVREPAAVELAEAISWTERTVTIANRPLRDLVAEMNRWYGLDIKVRDTTLLARTGAVDAPLDSLRAAIADVERSAGVEFGYEDAGKTMIFKARKGAGRTAPR